MLSSSFSLDLTACRQKSRAGKAVEVRGIAAPFAIPGRAKGSFDDELGVLKIQGWHGDVPGIIWAAMISIVAIASLVADLLAAGPRGVSHITLWALGLGSIFSLIIGSSVKFSTHIFIDFKNNTCHIEQHWGRFKFREYFGPLMAMRARIFISRYRYTPRSFFDGQSIWIGTVGRAYCVSVESETSLASRVNGVVARLDLLDGPVVGVHFGVFSYVANILLSHVILYWSFGVAILGVRRIKTN